MPDRTAEDARLSGVDRTGLRPRTPGADPQRTCVGCRQTDSRSTLLRVVAETREDGAVVLRPDPRRRLPGRGAWLHPSTRCLDLAVRRRALPRALRTAARAGLDDVRSWVEEMSQTLSVPMNRERV
ncbi:YlxR family protein [Marihabitans asiaticum]|uniref:YlxR family protein n=1 Tax=Marihabitans asiaticum TaxID=415218 RepID=UPI001B86593C|nr:YlxR family protein [Marihabitans asiaticum]